MFCCNIVVLFKYETMEAKLVKYTKSIIYEEAGKFEETRFEKKHNVIFSSSTEGSIKVAKEIADLIISKKLKGELCVLGLATGSSPIKVYEFHQPEKC